MKALYIFPHPDDESFGPAAAMSKQLREGHEVYLMTLTKGGATRKRHGLGLSVDEMGEVRFKEMLNVKKQIGLTGMNVLDLPDSGLKNMDPRQIENLIEDEIEKIKPDVVITYAVHGVSGFHDHLVAHAVVKRVFCEMNEMYGYPKRLCLLTVDKETSELQGHFKLSHSADHEIGCKVETDEQDIKTALKALDCYETYTDTINASGIRDIVRRAVCFEVFNEKHDKVLTDIFESIN